MDKLSDITGITVSWKTKSLIEKSYNSFRKFHPDMRIIIIDGSDFDGPCYSYVKSLASEKTEVITVGYNIGHGRGMCIGLYYTLTKYALFFDSDIEMLKSPVPKMMSMMEADTFGVGRIERTGFDGFSYGFKPTHRNEGWMPYLHPYFQLMNIENYKKFYPYIHHGAPCTLTMLDIYKKGLSNRVLKEFPGLDKYIKHEVAGTRKMRKQNGVSEIEGAWELNRGQV